MALVPPTLQRFKSKIFDLLSNIATDGQFGAQAEFDGSLDPGLFVDDLGEIDLPLSPDSAALLKSKCTQSPFGKGEDTLVDTSVRKSWELHPSQFSLTDPEWPALIKKMILIIHESLGLACKPEAVTAELNKLLLYEKGAFFKPHKDSEKTPGMFGTMVIILPSSHKGGELVLSHNEETMHIITNDSTSTGLFAAWYADVLHEVKPIKSGHRLVLTYNLIKRTGPKLLAPGMESTHRDLSTTLMSFERDLMKQDRADKALSMNNREYPPFLVHTLEFQYTQASLSTEALKGNDIAQVQLAMDVCADLHFDVYLATMELRVCTSQYRSDDDGQQLALTKIVDMDGNSRGKALELNETALLRPLDSDKKPDDEQHTGFTGNEGATSTYWYRDTVLVMVPTRSRALFKFYAKKTYKTAIKLIQNLRDMAREDSEARGQLLRLCRVLLDRPYLHQYYSMLWVNGPRIDDSYTMEQMLQELALATLEYGKVYMFENAAIQCKWRLLPETFSHLGRCAAKFGFQTYRSKLELALAALTTFASRYDALTKVQTTFGEVINGTDPVFETWVSNMMSAFLKNTDLLYKSDGASIARLAMKQNLEAFEQMAQRVRRERHAVKIGFVNCLVTHPDLTKQTDRDARLICCRAMILDFWKNIDLQDDMMLSTAEPAASSTGNQRSLRQTELQTSEELIATDLADWIENSVSPCGNRSMKFVLRKLVEGVDTAGEETCTKILVPFVGLMLRKQIGAFLRSSAGLADLQQIVTKILRRYILEFVGQEPSSTLDWITPSPGGCGGRCSDCATVELFLASPTEQVCRIKCGTNRRQHLHSYYTDARNMPYEVETIRGYSPNIWQITKKDSNDREEHQAWTDRFEVAKQQMQEFIDTGSLEDYLGDEFYSITSCRVEELYSENPQEGTSRLTGIRRSGTTLERDGQSKRARTEIIDLT